MQAGLPVNSKQELQGNSWFTAPADHDILFAPDVSDKWQMSARLIGIETPPILQTR